MKKIFFFDLDGTLTDSSLGITKAVSYSLKSFGIHVDDLTTLYNFIGPPLPESFRKYYGFSSHIAELATKKYREYYLVDGKFENRVYEGIEDLLVTLKEMGARLFVATSKPTALAEEVLEHFGLSKYFEYIGGSAPDDGRYKKVEVISWLLDQFQFEKEEVMMIGDHVDDILGASQNGIDSVAVLYGFGNETDIRNAEAKFVVESVPELKRVLIDVFGKQP